MIIKCVECKKSKKHHAHNLCRNCYHKLYQRSIPKDKIKRYGNKSVKKNKKHRRKYMRNYMREYFKDPKKREKHKKRLREYSYRKKRDVS